MSTGEITRTTQRQIQMDNESTAAFEALAAARKTNAPKQNIASTEIAEMEASKQMNQTGNNIMTKAAASLAQQVQSFS